MPETTFQATILKELTKVSEKVAALSPDTKHNTGRMISDAFMWDVIQKYAEKQSEVAWQKLSDEEIIDKTADLTAGDHTLAESPSFSVTLKQSEPRKGFKADVLQEALKKKYKVPLHTSKEMIEAAKVPGNPTRTYKILER